MTTGTASHSEALLTSAETSLPGAASSPLGAFGHAAEPPAVDWTADGRFFRRIPEPGVLPASPFEARFLSLAHGPTEVATVVAAAMVALEP